MNTAVKITAFAAAVAATFGTAFAVGKGVDPVVADPPTGHGDHAAAPGASAGAGAGRGGHGAMPPGGLQVSQGGYTLDLKTPRIEAGRPDDLRFVITGDDGRAVTAFQRSHDKELHLIIASRDLNTFRHVHPTRAADGTWSTPITLPEAGGYRVFADFTPDKKNAESLTLGADLAAAGDFRPQPLPPASATSKVDGYTVSLDGTLKPGAASELKLNVSKGGEPVTNLDPYLGAYGHLVALRSGDLAYLHVHPNGEPGDGTTRPGPAVSFTATAPSAGTYRLFLDFQHEGKVHTAAFTVHTGRPTTPPTPTHDESPTERPGGDDDGHQH
ncbi:hypothetical protein ACIQNU_16890 [Streptomyces sp. NPDC091292]|uniref:hypothetical protein n=1 Tax=Streptomyces sp. NPDC091292 TaxID=3365991 RepID=UPI003816C055